MATQPSSAGGPGDVDVIGARIAAQLIDMVAMFVLLFAFVFVGVSAVAPSESAAGGVAVLAFLVVGLGYGTLLEGAYGRTLGKMATDIRVVGRGGRGISYGQALVRNVPALFGGWPTWLVGMAAIAIDERNRRLFDQAASTYVVRDASGPRLTEQRREQFTR